jgi:hypothetical protein
MCKCFFPSCVQLDSISTITYFFYCSKNYNLFLSTLPEIPSIIEFLLWCAYAAFIKQLTCVGKNSFARELIVQDFYWIICSVNPLMIGGSGDEFPFLWVEDEESGSECWFSDYSNIGCHIDFYDCCFINWHWVDNKNKCSSWIYRRCDKEKKMTPGCQYCLFSSFKLLLFSG